MRAILITALIVINLGLAIWAYTENYTTRESSDTVRQLNFEIAQAKEKIRVLEAEWAYLNRPDRLEELATLNFLSLKLLNLKPEQFAQIGEIKRRNAEGGNDE